MAITYFSFPYEGIRIESSVNLKLDKEQIKKMLFNMSNLEVEIDDIDIISKEEFTGPRPCPYCGSDAELHTIDNGEEGNEYYYCCSYCKEGPETIRETQNEALVEWSLWIDSER